MIMSVRDCPRLKMVVLKIILASLMCVCITVESAKILGIFQMPSKSHHILGSALLKALAKRGHEVTMISPFPLKNPLKNYEDLELTGMIKLHEDMMAKMMEVQNASMFTKMPVILEMMGDINEYFLNHTVIKELLSSNRKFDLVIQCWFGNEAALAIPYFLGASTIAFSTVGSTIFTNALTANPAPFSYVPEMLVAFPDEMTFFQRVGNTLISLALELNYHMIMAREQERVRQKYFPTAPSTSELTSKISLVLLNSHFSMETSRPYVPGMVQIGGFHVEDPKELKDDLKKFMDSATDGVLFFSLGSNVKSSDLSKDKLNAIVECFAKLPLKVLWKFETDDIPKLSPNVKIGKWLPQRDILAHPNLKLFVTHGGLLSTIEAVHHGVPMVGIPVIGDQESNVKDGVNKGYVVRVAFDDISAATLTEAIKEVLNNPKYRENIKRRSMVLKDQPLKQMDNAIFWVEYVLRHKGAHHLKTSALKLQWYQYYLLDVIAFLGGIILIVCATSCFLLCKLYQFLKNLLCKKNKKAVEKSAKGKKKSKVA